MHGMLKPYSHLDHMKRKHNSRHSFLLAFGLLTLSLSSCVSKSIAQQVSSHTAQAQESECHPQGSHKLLRLEWGLYVVTVQPVDDDDEKEKCKPWQVKDKDTDKCVDKPGATHHHGHYDPGPHEQCWVECLCEEGEYPGDDSCAPCSYQGMVCVPN